MEERGGEIERGRLSEGQDGTFCGALSLREEQLERSSKESLENCALRFQRSLQEQIHKSDENLPLVDRLSSEVTCQSDSPVSACFHCMTESLQIHHRPPH